MPETEECEEREKASRELEEWPRCGSRSRVSKRREGSAGERGEERNAYTTGPSECEREPSLTQRNAG